MSTNIKQFAFIILCFTSFASYGQEPFDIATVDYEEIQVVDYTSQFGFRTASKTESIADVDSSDFSFFSQQNISMLFTNEELVNGQSFAPSANLSFIRYRLGIYSFKAKKDRKRYKKGETVKVYLPLIILSRFSLNYDSLNLVSANDATSFSGSPFTLRLMPSHNFKVGLENTLTVGSIVDFRGVYLEEDDGFNTDFGLYYSFGLKYAGNGDVRDENGDSYSGRWSLSALYYNYSGSGGSQERLFGDTSIETGMEFIFKFKVLDTKVSKFNLFANARYDFETDKDTPWVFQFGIGN